MEKRKGFTLVELVIVIAVIAILAAVMIPTMVSVINNAKRVKEIEHLHNLNLELATGELKAKDVAEEKLETTGWRLKYHKKTKRFVIVDEEGIIQESENGKLNGMYTEEDEDFLELNELEDPIGGIVGVTDNKSDESGNSGAGDGTGGTGETDPGDGTGGTGKPDPSEPSKDNQWWEKLEEITELSDKVTDNDKYKDLMEREELRLNVDKIPAKYFEGNKNLKRIYIGNVEEIGKDAFFSCVELEEVIGTAKVIGNSAFNECCKLQSFDFSRTKKSVRIVFTTVRL